MRRAIALQYDSEIHQAPLVISSGEGDLAARIERAARESGVAVVRDVSLAAALATLQIGDEIPEALYESIAAVLSEIGQGGVEKNERR